MCVCVFICAETSLPSLGGSPDLTTALFFLEDFLDCHSAGPGARDRSYHPGGPEFLSHLVRAHSNNSKEGGLTSTLSPSVHGSLS